jgi:hypothetical protein
MSDLTDRKKKFAFSPAMILITIGIVYGDIGTSPMYVLKSKLATPISNGGLTFTPPGSTTGSARGGVSQHLYYWSPAKSGLLLSSIL